MGRETLFLVDTGLGHLRALNGGGEGDRRHAVGDQVHIHFRDADTLLFDAQSERLLPDARVSVPA